VCTAESSYNCYTEAACKNVGLNWCTTGTYGACTTAECPSCDANNKSFCGNESACKNVNGNWCTLYDGTSKCSDSACSVCSSKSLNNCYTAEKCKANGGEWTGTATTGSYGSCRNPSVGVIPGVCGNSLCELNYGETSKNCATDCRPTIAECGNKICEAGLGETATSCPGDCKGIDVPTGYCGDNICDAGIGENASTCKLDCLIEDFYCGDNICDAGESKASCPRDCDTEYNPACLTKESVQRQATKCRNIYGTPKVSENNGCFDFDCSFDESCKTRETLEEEYYLCKKAGNRAIFTTEKESQCPAVKCEDHTSICPNTTEDIREIEEACSENGLQSQIYSDRLGCKYAQCVDKKERRPSQCTEEIDATGQTRYKCEQACPVLDPLSREVCQDHGGTYKQSL
jgi:hypothetical protein